jgi:hypothetical protein
MLGILVDRTVGGGGGEEAVGVNTRATRSPVEQASKVRANRERKSAFFIRTSVIQAFPFISQYFPESQ